MSKAVLDLRPITVPARRGAAVSRPVWAISPQRPTWPSIGLSLIFAFGAALSWVKGENGHYNGWLVALGWGLALIAWRTFANRKTPKNPAANLAEGAAIAVTGAALFLLRLAALALLIVGALWLLAAAEWLTKLQG